MPRRRGMIIRRASGNIFVSYLKEACILGILMYIFPCILYCVYVVRCINICVEIWVKKDFPPSLLVVPALLV